MEYCVDHCLMYRVMDILRLVMMVQKSALMKMMKLNHLSSRIQLIQNWLFKFSVYCVMVSIDRCKIIYENSQIASTLSTLCLRPTHFCHQYSVIITIIVTLSITIILCLSQISFKLCLK